MSTPLASHLDIAVAPGLPAALVSAASFATMRELTTTLPAALTEFFGLECRLWDEDAAADFLLHVSSPGGRLALAALAATRARTGAASSGWPRLHAFADAWANPAHPLHGRIDGTWLEFDLAGEAAGTAGSRTPSLFMSTRLGRRAGARDASSDDDWLVDAALPLLLGEAAAEQQRARLRPVLAALPPTAHVFQAGVMLSRASDALRLCVRGLTGPQTLTFLDAVGWPGSAPELTPWLTDAHALSDSVDLDIDVGGGGVQAKLGLECSCLQRPAPYGRQPGLLDFLVARGLCSPAKADGLRVWPRGFHERADPTSWPIELRERAREMGAGTVSMLLRWLYHVKLVVQPGVAPTAKAYLAVRQFWPNPATLPQMASTGEAYVSGTASTNNA